MRVGTAAVLATLLAAGAGAGAGAEERRELGAHEHGRSTLEVAVEGGRVTMALASPGADIAGFEHAAETDGQKAAVESARAALGDPLSLFGVPEAARCRVASAEVALETEEDHGHAEFRAEYALDCAEPAGLGSLDLAAFFRRFPDAEEVEARVVAARGQEARELTRAAPALRLGPAA